MKCTECGVDKLNCVCGSSEDIDIGGVDYSYELDSSLVHMRPSSKSYAYTCNHYYYCRCSNPRKKPRRYEW